MTPQETAAIAPPMRVPVTVSITRRVDRTRLPEVTRWVQSGVNLANRREGFLGSGWVRSHAASDEWHMLYRFADERSLAGWERSAERHEWLRTGEEFVEVARIEKRTGIEGWFDSPRPGSPPPPRWKQAVGIWLGFFPVSLVFNVVAPHVPGWNALSVPLAVLVTTLILTPIMTYFVLPYVTSKLQPWLSAPSAASRSAGTAARRIHPRAGWCFRSAGRTDTAAR